MYNFYNIPPNISYIDSNFTFRYTKGNDKNVVFTLITKKG